MVANQLFTKRRMSSDLIINAPGLLAYLLLRFISWEKRWKHTFNRLYTLARSVLLNYFDLTSVILSCDTIGRRGPKRIRGTPEQAYQMLFDFA